MGESSLQAGNLYSPFMKTCRTLFLGSNQSEQGHSFRGHVGGVVLWGSALSHEDLLKRPLHTDTTGPVLEMWADFTDVKSIFSFYLSVAQSFQKWAGCTFDWLYVSLFQYCCILLLIFRPTRFGLPTKLTPIRPSSPFRSLNRSSSPPSCRPHAASRSVTTPTSSLATTIIGSSVPPNESATGLSTSPTMMEETQLCHKPRSISSTKPWPMPFVLTISH